MKVFSKSEPHICLAVLTWATHRMAVWNCVYRINILLKQASVLPERAAWLVSRKWMEWREEQLIKRSSTVERWRCRTAALGGACRVREEEEGLLSMVAFEVGRRPAVSKLQMWRTKGEVFPYTIAPPFSSYWRDDEVSSWSPTELHLDSLCLLVRTVFRYVEQGNQYCV